MKKFEIIGQVINKSSLYCDDIEVNLNSKLSDHNLLIGYLNALLLNDSRREPEPLILWENVVIKLINLLVETGSIFVMKNLSDLANEDDLILNKKLTIAILSFLSRLLERADEKHYFQSIQTICEFMTSWDLDIASQSAITIFNLCVPSSSVFSYTTTELELKDNMELPSNVVPQILGLFEGLGMVSPDFSVLDFLKSFHIPGYSPLQDEIYLSVKKSSMSDQQNDKSNVKIPLNPIYEDVLFNENELVKCKVLLENVKQNNNVSTIDELVTISAMFRSGASYRGLISNKIRLITLRLRYFFMLLHSRISPEIMFPYLSAGSVFLKDLISLCDLNSELSCELKQLTDKYISLSSIAMESVVCLIAIVFRKRGTLLQHTGIMNDLGLRLQPSRSTRYTELDTQMTDVNWTTLIASTCQIAMSLIHNEAVVSENTLSDNYSAGRLIDSGLEFFLLCLTSVDQSASLGSLLTSVVGVIRCTIPVLQMILQKCGNISSSSIRTLSTTDSNIMLLVARAYTCLESYIDHGSSRSNPHYNEIMQDSNCLTTVSDILDLFGKYIVDHNSDTATAWLKTFSLILESIFSFLSSYYKANRRRMISPSDSGIQIVRQHNFAQISSLIFGIIPDNLEFLWHELLFLYKEAIDLDPSLMSEVINGVSIGQFVKSIKKIDEDFSDVVKTHHFLLSFARLSKSICINSEGQSFISINGFVKYIINFVGHKSSLLPVSIGFDIETISSIGKALALISRESDRIRDTIEIQMESSIIYVCSETQHIIENISSDYNEISSLEYTLNSPRMQSLKKLANYVTLCEQMYSEMKRTSGSASRCVSSGSVITGLVQSYVCTLPLSKQTFAQLGVRTSQAMPSAHYGFAPSAKAITSFLKLQAANSPQLLLNTLLKSIDTTLNQISIHKQSLKNISESTKLSIPLSEVSSEFDLANSMRKTRKQRSRGSSLTDDSGDLLILGILDAIPNKCAFDSDLFNKNEDLEVQIWKFLNSVIYLEWLTLMLSYTLKPSPMMYSRTIDKEVLRRLYGFHRSSLMEVCRFIISKWKTSALPSNRMSSFASESFADFDSSEDESPIPRIPFKYIVRVISSSGALLREDCEIEGSRVTFLADYGCICTAYERKQTSSGVVRYRTSHGWLSEYRKDSQSEIVEILHVLPWDDSRLNDSYSTVTQSETIFESNIRKLREMMTLRESVCFSLMRINMTLRIVAMHLSHSTIQYSYRGSHRNRRGETDSTISSLAPLISKSLTKIIKGLFSYSKDCLKEFEYNESLQLVIPDQIKYVINPSNNKKGGLKIKEPKIQSSKDSFKSKEFVENDGMYVNKATICLYFEMVSKYIILPVLDDRNGHINTHLLRYFMSYHAIEDFMDALVFVVSTYVEAISEYESKKVEDLKLSVDGQASVHALPHMFAILRKLIQPKVILDSQITTCMKLTPDSYFGQFHSFELISYINEVIGKKILPILTNTLIIMFPPHIQIEWYNIISDYRANLSEKLPPPDVTDYQPSSGKSISKDSNQSQNFIPSRSRQSLSNSDLPSVQATPAAIVPDESVISLCMDMGFGRQQTVDAINSISSNDMNNVMEYLFSNSSNSNTANTVNPEDLAAADGDIELMAALQMSLMSTNETEVTIDIPVESQIQNDNQASNNFETGVTEATGNDLNNHSFTDNRTIENVVREVDNSNQAIEDTQSSDELLSRIGVDISRDLLFSEFLNHPEDRFHETGLMAAIDEIRNPFHPPQNLTDPEDISNDILQRMNRLINRKSVDEPQIQSSPSTSTTIAIGAASITADHKNREIVMKSLLEQFNQDLLKENFIFSCIYASSIVSYSENSSNISFISQLFQILLNMNISTLYPILLTNLIDYTKLFILSESNSNNQSPSEKDDWSGILNMILCFIRHRKLEIINSNTGLDLFNTLLASISNDFDSSRWPSWMSSASVILYELLLLTKPENVVSKNEIKLNESKEENTAIEEKTNDILDEPIINKNSADIESLCNNIYMKMLDAYVISRDLWNDLYDVIISILVVMSNSNIYTSEIKYEVKHLPDIYSGLLLILSVLVSEPNIATKFAQHDIIKVILTIKNAYSAKDNTNILSKVLQIIFHIIKSHNFEYDINQIFVKNDKTVDNDKCSINSILLNDFMKKLFLNSRIFTHTKEICRTILNMCVIIKKDKNGKEGKNDNFDYYIQLNKEYKSTTQNHELLKENDLQYKLIQHLFVYVIERPEDSVYTIDDILNCICDSLLSHRGITSPTSKVIALDISKLVDHNKPKSKINLVDFIVKTYIARDLINEKQLDLEINGIRSSCRFLITLCSKRGITRKLVLNSITKYMKLFCKPLIDNSVDESNRLTIITRLALFLQILFKACVKTPVNTNDNENATEAILQLLENSITDILTESLAFIPLTNTKASDAINAILEPLETLSRPQYQASYNNNEIGNINKAINIKPSDGLTDTALPDDLNDHQAMSQLAAILGNSSISISYNNDNFLNMSSITPQSNIRVIRPGRNYEDADSEEDSDEEPDEIFEIVDEAHDVDNDEDEDDEDDDEDEDNEGDDDDEEEDVEMDEEEVEIEEDQHHDNNENEEEESDSDSVDSAYHSWVLRNANSNVRSSNGPFTTELNISALNRMRGNVPSDINLYVTPPDRIRQDPLQVIMTDLRTGNVLESPEDMIRRLIQDASDNIGLFNSSTDAVYALRNNGIVAMSSVSQNSSERVSNNGNNLTSQFLRQALPGGIDMALQVHRPVLLHPLLAGTEFLQQTNRSGNSTNSNSNDANIDNIGGSSQSSRFPLIRSDNMRIFDIPHGPPGAIRRDAIISHQVSDNRETSTIRDLSPTFIGNDVIASILLDNLVSALTDNCLVDNDPVPLLVDHVVSQNESTNETQIVPDSPNIQLAEESEAVPADDDETIVDTNEGIDNYSATESEVTRVENVGDVLTIGSSATESIGTSINESLMGNRSLQDTLAGTSLSVSILTNDAIRGPTDFDNVSMLSSIPTSESDDDEEAKENVTDNGEIVQNNIIFEDVVTDLNQTNIVTEMNDNEIEDSPSNVLQDNDTSDLNEPLQESAVPQVSAIACPVGYDSDVFYSLPENMQLEIMEQHSQTSQQTRQLIEQAGYDYEMFESLPENIRQEILDQARRDSGGNNESLLSSAIPAEPTPSDNVSFLMSLTPELRADILLTADAAFLDSLPSDLFAEAQRHRDQAARRLQDQEILRTEYQSNNLQRSNNATIQSVIGRLGLSDTLGINDNEEDEELGMNPLRNIRNTMKPTTKDIIGYIKLPNDDIPKLSLPNRLLAILTKVFCSSSIKLNVEILQQLLSNLSKNPNVRDITLRILIGLLSNNKQMFIESLLKLDISLFSAKAIYSLLIKSSENASIFNSKTYYLLHNNISTKIVNDSPNSAVDALNDNESLISDDFHFIIGQEDISIFDVNSINDKMIIPSHISQSLIYLLNHLLNQNSNVVYDTIRPRITRGGDSINILSNNVQDSVTNSVSDELMNNPSSNSLLEILIDLLSYENIIRNSNDLSSIILLILKSTQPFDLINDNNNETIEPPELKDNKDFYKPIPYISLAKESLQSLCDILLSDLCTKKIFSDINIIISRLIKLKSNHIILLHLLCSIVDDLIEQSHNKLIRLFDILNHITNSNNQNKMNISSALTLIPISEIGSKQHDHLLKTIQTLLLISNKVNTQLSNIINHESIYKLMYSLDNIFSYLKDNIIIDDTTNSKTAINVNTPNTSILTTILNRLLPCLQTVILFNTHDVCAIHDLANKSDSKQDAKIDNKESSINTNESDNSVDSKTVQTPSNKATIAITVSIPGLRHRQSYEYKRMNISLIDESQTSASTLPTPTQSFVYSGSINPISLLRSKSLKPSYNPKSHHLITFIQNHSILINLIIESQSSLLEKSLNSLIRIIQLRQFISFENKRKYFNHQLSLYRRNSQLVNSIPSHSLHLHVRREYVFEDSYDQLRGRSKDEILLGRLQVTFNNEQGIDAGGLTREWFSVLSKEIFNPNYALFTSALDGATFQPNPFSMINSNHLSYFKFIGNVIGKAINDGQLMDAHFTRSFYKHLLGIPVDYVDIEATEPDYYNTLKQILDNPLESLMIDLTFSAESQIFGKTEVVDLIPNGRNIPVDDENKFDYVRLISHHRMTTAIKAQIESFLDGFYQLIPPELISIFSPTEIELLICGLPDVDITDLKANTEYHGVRLTDEIISWFWEALNGFSQTERASFLQFVTGTSKVPLGGFSNLQGMRGTQKFSIHKAYGDHNQLPTAHTCFNQLDLPIYNSYEELKAKLLLAIREGSEGFGFA